MHGLPLPFAILLLGLSACEGGEAPAAAGASASSRSEPTASAGVTSTTVSTGSAVTAQWEGPPLEAEWQKATAAEVEGGKPLGCEARVVRSTVRIICTKTADRPGPDAITDVESNQRVTTKAVDGTAFVESPFEPGLEAHATFVWGEQGHVLSLRWPAEGQRPARYGAFGPAIHVANPCKPAGLVGFGTRSNPCHIKGASPLVLTWTKEYEADVPVFAIENRTGHAVSSYVFRVAYLDGARKPVDKRASGLLPTDTAYTHSGDDLPIAGKERRPYGRSKKDIPPTTQTIEVVALSFEQRVDEKRTVHYRVDDP